VPPFSSSSSGQQLYIQGINYGTLPAPGSQFQWTPAELALEAFVGGSPCLLPNRVESPTRHFISCTLSSTSGLVNGPVNASVTVAGQTGVLPNGDARSLYIACKGPETAGATTLPGGYGFVGELCLPCPIGAVCPGFQSVQNVGGLRAVEPPVNPFASALRGYGVNVTALPAAFTLPLGRVQAVMTSSLTGFHSYPIPLPGFFNLNGTAAVACPAAAVAPFGRDVCLVACVPSVACLADNVCASGYISIPPTWRCSTCAPGFYRLNGACTVCPSNPYAVIIVIGVAIVFIAAIGYFLSKYDINIGLVSIGIDFFQTLAVASNSQVPWPPQLQQVFLFFSAFNLNIDIVAPECFLSNVTYVNKFYAIITIPLGLFALFFVAWALRAAWMRVAAGQRVTLLGGEAPRYASSAMLMLYLFYLYVAKSTLDIFTCVPSTPPDGNLYLITGGVSTGVCGAPGSASVVLQPLAVFALICYVIGFPALVGALLWRFRERVMEDQLLRANGTGGDALSNPHALAVRECLGRMYFLFKPTRYYWIMVIFARKFALSFIVLVFSINVSFQLAAALVLLFCSYAAQVRYKPFMSKDEHAAVLREHITLSLTDPLHNRLRASLAQAEAHGRKRGVAARGMVAKPRFAESSWGAAARYLLNYNNVDATLLFAAVATLLAGILFVSVRPTDNFYAASNAAVLGVAMLIVVLAILYWTVAMVTDIYLQVEAAKGSAAAARRLASSAAKAAAGKRRGGGGGGGGLAAADASPDYVPTNVFSAGFDKDSREEVQSNPLFARADGSAVVTSSQAIDAIRSMAAPPAPAVWTLIREQFVAQDDMLSGITAANGELKAQIVKLQAQLDSLGGDLSSEDAAAQRRARLGAKREFAGVTKAPADAAAVAAPAAAADDGSVHMTVSPLGGRGGGGGGGGGAGVGSGGGGGQVTKGVSPLAAYRALRKT
jgi:hypothetical protein